MLETSLSRDSRLHKCTDIDNRTHDKTDKNKPESKPTSQDPSSAYYCAYSSGILHNTAQNSFDPLPSHNQSQYDICRLQHCA